MGPSIVGQSLFTLGPLPWTTRARNVLLCRRIEPVVIADAPDGRTDADGEQRIEAILSVDKPHATNTRMFPIWLHGGSLPGAVFHSTLASITKGNDEFVANLVAHEVGHSLGLGHGLQVTASGYDLLEGSADKTRGIVTTEHSTGGQVVLKWISPVHAEMLRRDYL